MIDLDKLAVELLKSTRDREELNQARISLMVQNDEGFVMEQVYTIRYYESRDGLTDYHWSISSNPITR